MNVLIQELSRSVDEGQELPGHGMWISPIPT
jgi:hypothetical protein